ncbi:serine protease [Sphaerotilus hippei]|uniref:Serine protease n=1 Tax=Sphaerotilus hippei TaxID=744406 RepID=A0A318GY59_9BURK|nr:S8 family serine peptidase [Sphaerotilus hippei]PXW94967.1 serine protease [Sphaerotilus hippei]
MFKPSASPLARRLIRGGAAACMLAGLTALLGTPPVQAVERQPARLSVPAATSARVIVKFRSTGTGTNAAILSASGSEQALVQRASTLGQRLSLNLVDGHTIAPRTQVITASGLDSTELARRLAADSEVEYAVPDQRRRVQAAPNDPLYGDALGVSPATGQWYLRAPTATVRSSIHATTAWAVSTGSASVVVAVLDTGVRSDHPDLAGKLLAGYDFVTDVATANDGDGRDADPSDPGDWITATENTTRNGSFQGCGASDSSWHGTQTAGLVGALTNNGVGMASIGRQVMVLPVRVLGKCGGYDSDIQAAMRWAAGLSVAGVPTNPNPAKVISMSLGSAGACNAAYEAVIAEVRTAGVTIVASAGNDGLATNTPANCGNVIAVGGLRHLGTKNGFASLGPEVTISAPAGNCVNASGECVYPMLSTSNTGTTTPGSASYTSGGSDYAVGTSFSAPLVAGTAGLMLSVDGTLTPDGLSTRLQQTARAFPTSGADSTVAQCTAPGTTEQLECYCTTSTCGAGMLDAGAAVIATAAMTGPVAVFDISPDPATAGQTITLDASSAVGTTGSTLTNYLWTLTTGSGTVLSFSGAVNTVQTTLIAHAAGTATVTLLVTDSTGATRSHTETITIQAAPTTGSGDSGGGGGGALSWPWAAGLAVLLLGWAGLRRRAQR